MSTSRAALRLVAALASVAAGFAAAVLVIAATGGPDVGSALVAMALLVLGFLGLRVARTARAPLRPMRIALAIGLPVAAYLLAGLPWPPGRDEVGSFAVLAAGIALSGSALVAAAQGRARLACALLAPPAAYGAVMLASFARTLAAAHRPGEAVGPAATLAFMLAATVAAAWATALWHARPLWGAFRTRLGRAT